VRLSLAFHAAIGALLGFLVTLPALIPLLLAPFHGARTRAAIVGETTYVVLASVMAGTVAGLVWALLRPVRRRVPGGRTLSFAAVGAALAGTAVSIYERASPFSAVGWTAMGIGAVLGAYYERVEQEPDSWVHSRNPFH
jgi:hypothetical protein